MKNMFYKRIIMLYYNQNKGLILWVLQANHQRIHTKIYYK